MLDEPKQPEPEDELDTLLDMLNEAIEEEDINTATELVDAVKDNYGITLPDPTGDRPFLHIVPSEDED